MVASNRFGNESNTRRLLGREANTYKNRQSIRKGFVDRHCTWQDHKSKGRSTTCRQMRSDHYLGKCVAQNPSPGYSKVILRVSVLEGPRISSYSSTFCHQAEFECKLGFQRLQARLIFTTCTKELTPPKRTIYSFITFEFKGL